MKAGLLTAALLLSLVAIFGPLAPTVDAHRFSAHDFESVPQAISPAALSSGISFEMVDYDGEVRLKNASGKRVFVDGYEGEPYARLDPDGRVFLNTASPAFYLNQDRFAETAVDPEADPASNPVWEQEADDGTLTWFDKRSHSMSKGMPAAVVDPENPQRLRTWAIPLTIGGVPAELAGTLYWSGKKPFPMKIVAGLLIATCMCAALGVFAIEALRRGGPEDHHSGV
jgi:hypothetical protein